MTAVAKTIGVVVVDDNRLLGDSMARWLLDTPGFRWIGWAAAAESARELVERTTPDVVLLDLDIPGVDTMELVRWMVAHNPSGRVVMLTGHYRHDLVERALAAGASGYIVKDERPAEILSMMRRVARGEVVLSETARRAGGR